jgi:predicted O-methyltransferase YrrM
MAMQSLEVSGPFSGETLARGYDWDKLGARTFVDCGGSTGHIASRIAAASKIPKFIVQDFNADTVATAQALQNQKKDTRISFVQHDFFTTQPVKGADVYFFRLIFHDWEDEDCLKILHNLTPALKRGARVLICDFVLPEPNTTSTRQFREGR